LGVYQPLVSRTAGAGLGLLAAALATTLFELSRLLADRYKGRWFAGNGRDVFHAGAAASVAGALFLNGLPAALACAMAGTAAVVPLMVLDWIDARRRRLQVVLIAVTVGILPALVAPRATVDAGNATARALFSTARR
jgi:hypothetical protein